MTYPVTIRVDSTESGQLPEGLSATAQVIIREQTDSVLIPLQALYGSVQAPTVRVVSGNDIIERQVSLGISDDFWVVVEEGLNEGETISMEVVGSSTSGFGGIGATFRAVGGGFGGGGRLDRPVFLLRYWCGVTYRSGLDGSRDGCCYNAVTTGLFYFSSTDLRACIERVHAPAHAYRVQYVGRPQQGRTAG